MNATQGIIKMEFFPNEAHQTCRELQNTFTSRVLQWDTLFHRIDKDFVIQGGDPNTRQNGAGREQWGTGGPVL
ncbi:MAG TPA: peptidylprolyl isomerase [Nitrososphaeraceae archaeon]|nr:peptidylprolyl isomerase [Nitrososphaeraceae archaeon]